MLESTALRALCCTEQSSVKEAKASYELWQQVKDDLENAEEVEEALKKIPYIHEECQEEDEPCALYVVGAIVWCKEMGWGSWPGTVRSVDNEQIIIDYSPNEFTEVDADEVSSRLRPFLEGFSACVRDVTSLGNCSSDFEKSVNDTLEKFAPLLPNDVIAEHIRHGVRGRWLQRMLKIAGNIDTYLKCGSGAIAGRAMRRALDKRAAEIARALEIEEKRRAQQEARLLKSQAPRPSRYPSLSIMETILGELWGNNSTENSVKRGRSCEATRDLTQALLFIVEHIRRLENQEEDVDEDDRAPKTNISANAIPQKLQKCVHHMFTVLSNGVPADDSHIELALRMHMPLYVLRLLLLCYMPSSVYRNNLGMTLVHIAAKFDNAAAINLLCEHWKKYTATAMTFIQNREVDLAFLTDNYKRTAMHFACEAGSMACLQLLHSKGLDIHQRDLGGYTPLLWCASRSGSSDCAFYLLSHGADANVVDKKGKSTLYHTMLSGLTSLSKALVQQGIWLDETLMRTFVSDMSMGREPHRIIFDTRSIAECRVDYLTEDPCNDTETRATNGEVTLFDSDDSDESINGADEPPAKKQRAEAIRCSHRVSSLTSDETVNQYSYEKKYWTARPHMLRVCSETPQVVPKFVYSTETLYKNSEEEESLKEGSLDSSDDDTVLCRHVTSSQCCSCEGDCSVINNCPCIMRNGQRYPYTADGRFDFSKPKIYECGPSCGCSKEKCKLRVSQRGVSFPMIVCRTGEKGFGVMTTKSILKGSFVCAYVGEDVSEDDLQKQEDKKMAMNAEGFVTYAFQIHEGNDDYNIDSEYVGNVARFFNHSCSPNMKPIKVETGAAYPTMAFFALRRIEAGEELTWKYVSGTTRRSGQQCHCNSPECIGFV